MFEASFENLAGIMNLIADMGLFICLTIIGAVMIEIFRGIFEGYIDAETLDLTEYGKIVNNAINELKKSNETVMINNSEIPVKKLFVKSLFKDSNISNSDMRSAYKSLNKDTRSLINIIRPDLRGIFQRGLN